MKIFFDNNSKIKKIIIILIILFIFIGLYIYGNIFYVIIRFNEIGALTKNMSVYYNGFKIGKIVKISPDKTFKNILVRVNLIHKKIDLPQNTIAKVENFPNGELYLQFVYPESPSLKIIKSGDILEGIAPYSMEQFMLGQNISGVSDIVSLHVINALKATEVANQEMQAFFKHTSKLIEENSKAISTSTNNIATMTKNLAQMAENLNKTSKKINNALDETTLKSTTLNIKDSTENLKNTTEFISKATEDIDKTMKKLDDTIFQASETAQNLNSISSGLKISLSQRFAGMRIMFGTPIKQKNNYKNACN